MDEPTPAIRRDYDHDRDRVTVVATMYDSVSFNRGLGDSGRRVELVENDCPFCGWETMVRRQYVNPECRDTVSYWCNNPSCRYHHRSAVAGAKAPVRPPSEPEVTE